VFVSLTLPMLFASVMAQHTSAAILVIAGIIPAFCSITFLSLSHGDAGTAGRTTAVRLLQLFAIWGNGR
jgi:hypothetical protein